ncbi:penicillin-binding protein 1A [Peptoclostridium litorale DSM 5388]|uniref:Penicillin-binding protein 1A n=1 Tax=Peptoclostridium litorale DSM 5388 TaxID=1121324 RepID=A0A069RH81_PEPLI|nr:transglycosylase domain-containing protein [Peptoclostridium litorale]KDR96118.1 penicillin-binding protein 1A [Peptoclostridium litorale DSM 5388]SIO04252.1 penicillin-binding protein 1A [Peptoclostridium litorale DSM 5388]
MDNNRSVEKENNKKKKKKKKKFISIKVVLLSLILVMMIGVASVAGIVYGVIKNTQPIDVSNIQNLLDDSSFIYDKNGSLIEKVHSDNFRSIVTMDKIPKDLQNAFVSIEDERFYSHKGVDPKRIIGAIVYDLKTMSKAQGASTITQQLAKNIYLTHEKTYTRKIKDMYYALALEKNLTKDQILELYMNTIYLGRGATGVQAAAQTYFSKDVGDLNIAECAIIAGITKYPSKYSPFMTERLSSADDVASVQLIFYPKSAETSPASEDEKSMFSKLLQNGRIDKFQYDQLIREEIVVRKAVLSPDSIKRQKIVLSKMYELGHITKSEYDEAQNYQIQINIGTKKVSGISSYFGDMVKNQVISSLMDEKGFSEDEARDTLYKGGLRIYSTMDMNIQKIVEKEFDNPENFPGSYKDSSGTIQPQSSMVIMDHSNGQVRALVGGRLIGGNKIYNRAINPRQPGSSIKPLAVYLPALDKGMTAATVINDSPHYDEKGNLWPRNYDRKYGGPSTARQLLKRSSNVGTVVLAEMLGETKQQSISTMVEYLEKLGISTVVTRGQNPRVNDENLSLALGGMSRGVTNLEMTAAYGAIANNGVYIEPVFFTRVETSDGSILLEKKPKKRTVVSPQTAFVMGDMLKSVVDSGTGARAKIPNMAVAGKTGTTSNQYDAWFAGYTPYYAGATWIGSDMPQPLSSGSKMSAMLWNKIMKQVHSNTPGKQFHQPENIVRVSICTKSGNRLSEYCSLDPAGTVMTELFVKGTEPQGYCSYHSTPPVIEPDPNEVPPEGETPGDPQTGESTDQDWQNAVNQWVNDGNSTSKPKPKPEQPKPGNPQGEDVSNPPEGY